MGAFSWKIIFFWSWCEICKKKIEGIAFGRKGPLLDPEKLIRRTMMAYNPLLGYAIEVFWAYYRDKTWNFSDPVGKIYSPPPKFHVPVFYHISECIPLAYLWRPKHEKSFLLLAGTGSKKLLESYRPIFVSISVFACPLYLRGREQRRCLKLFCIDILTMSYGLMSYLGYVVLVHLD